MVKIEITNQDGQIEKFVVDSQLKTLIMDAFISAEYQDENWKDEDTCDLIIRKLKGESSLEYLK